MKTLNQFRTLDPKPKVSLVGAGPGDPELLTLKGLAALQSADAVLYDALVDPRLLAHCPAHCEQIFVGKRPGESHSQAAINALMVEKAYALGHVVRLKGGDPFVFGRGQEEILYAQQFGIETAYIPGISSAVAGPGLAGIPLTSRGHSDGFWVMTGTKSDGSLSNDLALGLQSQATLVILMGMHRLAEIQALAIKMERGALPAAIVQSISTSEEKISVGQAQDLTELAKQEGMRNPAIIVLGAVVQFAQKEWVQALKNSLDQPNT